MLSNKIALYKFAQNVSPLEESIDIHATRYTNQDLAKSSWSSRGFHPLLPSFTVVPGETLDRSCKTARITIQPQYPQALNDG